MWFLLYALQNEPIKVFDFLVLYFFFCEFHVFIFLCYCSTIVLACISMPVQMRLFTLGLYGHDNQEKLLA